MGLHKNFFDPSINTNFPLLNAKGTSNEETFLTIGGDEKIRFDHLNSSGSTRLAARSKRTYEARDKWYHIVLRVDTTQSDSDKIIIYIWEHYKYECTSTFQMKKAACNCYSIKPQILHMISLLSSCETCFLHIYRTSHCVFRSFIS